MSFEAFNILPHRRSVPERIARVLWSEKWIFLLTLCTLMGGAIVYIRRIPPVYQSRGEVLIEYPRSTEKLLSAGSETFGVGQLETVRGNPLNNQIALITSRSVFERAAEEANLSGISQGGLSARVVSGSDVIQIVYRHHSPEVAQQLVDSLIKVYQRENLLNNREKASAARQFLEEALPRVRQELETAQDRLEQFRRQHTFVGSQEVIDGRNDTVNQLQDRVNSTQANLRFTEAKIAQLQGQLPTDLTTSLGLAGLTRDPSYQELQNQLTRTESELASLLSRYTEENPRVLATLEERDRLQGLLQTQAQRLLGEEIDASNLTLDPLKRGLVEDWFAEEVERAAQTARLQQLDQQLQEAQQQFAQLPELLKQENRLQIEVNKAQQTYLAFTERFSASQLIEQQSLSNVRVVEPPGVNRRPVAPNRRLLYALSASLSVVAALGAVGLRWLMNNRLEDTGSFVDILPLPILALLPRINHGRLAQQSRLADTDLLCSYQLLQAHLRMLPRNVQVIGVCSWTGSEGSSLVAENLALLEAQFGQKILLIDTHTSPERLPKCRRFNPRESIDPLTGNSVRSLQGFDILSYGLTATLAFYKKWSMLLERARKHYDLIIIDCPPAHYGSSATMLASLSDGILWVAAPQHLGRRGAAAAAEMLRTWQTRLLGQVLMGSADQHPRTLPLEARLEQTPTDLSPLPGGET
jgi:uncharacterized protein involved in exopolysaccharide biosynthesis